MQGMNDGQKGLPRWMAWFASHKLGRWLSKNLYTPLDKLVYKLTKGRRGLSPARAVLLLETIGRKSGQRRQVPILYLRDDDRLWVVASNYGQERHPAWSLNLLANPHARVTIGNESRAVAARLGTQAEKEALWPRLLELYPAWSAYSEWTDRQFRLFCLQPTDELEAQTAP